MTLDASPIPQSRPNGPSGSGLAAPLGKAAAVVGLQWGDEGKGKIVDILAGEHDVVARYNGGANAGHSVVIDGKRHALHLVPAGALRPSVLAVIGNGVVVQPTTLLNEMDELKSAGCDLGGLRVSNRAHVVMPYHIAEDRLREKLLARKSGACATGEQREPIGTTLRGIGPAYAEKMQRSLAIRMGDLLREATLRDKVRFACEIKSKMLAALDPSLADFDADAITAELLDAGSRLSMRITDTVRLLHRALDSGQCVLFEGANGALLDVDHGTYPFVTSSNASALGIGAGAGVPAARLSRVVGVVKAYCTRVGAGPFPTEDAGQTGDRIRTRGNEFGTTTGRPRRCGWLDLVALRYAAKLNGCTEIAVTLLDVLGGFDELRLCVAYDIAGERTDWFPADAALLEQAMPVYERIAGFPGNVAAARSLDALPASARAYLDRIAHAASAPVSFVSVGPDRDETIAL